MCFSLYIPIRSLKRYRHQSDVAVFLLHYLSTKRIPIVNMNSPIRPNLSNSRDHHEVNETMARVHVPTDHDRLLDERFNERVDFLRVTGRMTLVEAEWAKYDHMRHDEPA